MKTLFGVILFSLVFQVQGQQYALRQFTAVDGLPQSQVNAMIEDNNGYLWIGTAGGGLARFDGKNFKVYTTLDGLLSNMITSLMMDSQDNVWVIHPRGISKFNGSTFVKFQSPGIATAQGRLRRLYEVGDTIFFTSSPGVLGKIYKDSVFYWYKPIEKNKLIYFGTRSIDKDAYFYLSDSSFLIKTKKGEQYKLSHKNVFSRVQNMFNYREKVVINSDKGYYHFNDATSGFEKATLQSKNNIVAYDEKTSSVWSRFGNSLLRERESGAVDTVLTNVSVSQILFDREGNTWIGTSGMGMYKYSVRDFDRCGSEKLGAVMAVFVDRAGATWLGTNDMGVWKIHKGKIKHYRFPDDRSATVTAIAQTRSGEHWVASFQGLGRYDSLADKFIWYVRENGLTSQFITSLESIGDEIWFGSSDGGLMHYDGNKFESFPTGRDRSNVPVYAVHHHQKSDKIFIGTELGFSALNKGKVESMPLPELNNSGVLSIHTFRDSLLVIGSAGAGVVIFDPVKRTRTVLSSKDGLRSNLIYFVAEDEDHYLWIGTEQGIHRVMLDKNLSIIQNQHYSHNNGLTGVEANHNAFFFGKEKFFGMIDGVYQFNDINKTQIPPNTLHLTAVDILYGEESTERYATAQIGFFKTPQQLSLPPDKNHITFSFSRVDKRNPESVRYKYFLENFDKTWSPSTAVGTITYGNLPPGDYTLNVVATNKIGSWDIQPMQYSFSVQAPFYQKAFFLISMLFLTISLVILYFYWRVRQRVAKMLEVERIRQQEQDHIRKEIARDFHDEMGNQLTRIINYISLIKISKNGQVAELYNKVEDSAKYLYSGTRDFIWSIDPMNDELSKLFIHIRDFGEKLFEEKGIHFRAFNEVKDKIKVPYGFCREANLIFKEAMTNAFNHSSAKNVSFYLRKSDHGFELLLEDDGAGFSMADLEKPNGLRNMRSRAERIRSILRINSTRNGGGTTISLQFKIATNHEKYVVPFQEKSSPH